MFYKTNYRNIDYKAFKHSEFKNDIFCKTNYRNIDTKA